MEVTVHGMSVDINGDRLGAFFARYGEVEAGIATGVFVVQVTLIQKSFREIPNVLICWEKMMPVVVEGRRPYCWSCSALGHISKACLRQERGVTA